MDEPADDVNESLAGEPGTVSSAAAPLDQPRDFEMAEAAESQKSWQMAEREH